MALQMLAFWVVASREECKNREDYSVLAAVFAFFVQYNFCAQMYKKLVFVSLRSTRTFCTDKQLH